VTLLGPRNCTAFTHLSSGITCAAGISALYERMVAYRLSVAAVLLIAWVLLLTASAGDAGGGLNQTSGLLLTNLEPADGSHNDDLSVIAFHPVGCVLFKIGFLSIKSIEAPMPWRRKDDDSYQLNCAFLL